MEKTRIPAKNVVDAKAWAPPTISPKLELTKESKAINTQQNLQQKKHSVRRSLTVKELDAIAQQAYDEGKQLGYQEGLTAGGKDIQAQLAKQLAQLKSLCEGVTQPFTQHREQTTQAMVNLAVIIAERVAQQTLQTDATADAIKNIIELAINALPDQAASVTIQLNPQDFALLNTLNDLPKSWRLESVAAVSPGGCKLFVEDSLVDYTTEQRFIALVKGLVDEQFRAALTQSADSPSSGSHSVEPDDTSTPD